MDGLNIWVGPCWVGSCLLNTMWVFDSGVLSGSVSLYQCLGTSIIHLVMPRLPLLPHSSVLCCVSTTHIPISASPTTKSSTRPQHTLHFTLVWLLELYVYQCLHIYQVNQCKLKLQGPGISHVSQVKCFLTPGDLSIYLVS